MKIKISDIKIGSRQRIEMGDISELADSMLRLGQIHNIGVNEQNVLIWGMRRTLAAKELGWEELECTQRHGLTPADEQEIELEEDIRRKNRTWQEECIALTKLFAIKSRQAREKGETFGVREMATYTGFGKSFVAHYVNKIGVVLLNEPKDTAVWDCPTWVAALDLLRDRREKEAYADMQRRRQAMQQAIAASPKMLVTTGDNPSSSPVQRLEPTVINPKPTLTLRERALAYSKAFEHLGPPNTPLFYLNKDGREFIHGFWFVGGGNISLFYGSYQIEYLKRINSLFPDCQRQARNRPFVQWLHSAL